MSKPPPKNAFAPKLYYNEEMKQHTSQWPHIEKCTRAVHASDHLKERGLLSQCQEHAGRAATDAELATVHPKKHIDEVRRMTAAVAADPTNRQLREPDGPGGVYYSPHADTAARLACGCVIDATLDVIREAAAPPAKAPRGYRPVSFALVRPPGHHAGADDTPGHRAEGFCFYNSVAVAAGCALAQGVRKIAILDWDVHHGNGTQHLFYEEARVLYISLHRFGDRWYPETGELDEVGAGAGVGRNVNIPWPENGMHDTDYLAAFTLVVLPILRAFGPDLLVISAGFDAADGDAQGRMKVTPAGFAQMTAMLLQTVSCPVCCALEGGYNRLVTSECCEAVLRVLLGEQAPMPPPQLLSRCCEPTLRAVMSTQKAHWPVLSDDSEGVLDRFFAEAAAVGQPERMSKRARAAPTRQYEDEPDPCKSFHSPRSGASLTAKSPKLDAEAAALKAAVDKTAKTLARTEEAHAKAAHKVDAARQTLTREECALGAAEDALERARKAHEAALAAAAAAVVAVASSSSDHIHIHSSDPSDETGDKEDDTNGTSNPQPTCLWSAKVKCEVGRRVFAQYGSSADELWFRGTITGVHRNDVGQWCDVEYDDGDTEAMKPIKRVRAIDDSSDSEDEGEEDEGEEE